MTINQWTKIPTGWIVNEKKLQTFNQKELSTSIASLLVYSALIIKCSQTPENGHGEGGYTKMSYSELEDITSLSRTLISRGIRNMETLNLISVNRNQKPSEFKIIGFQPQGWAKFPAKQIMKLKAFDNLHIRHKNELNALKLLFLIIAFRDNNTNTTSISYDKIQDYTKIHRTDVRSAISLLVVWGLIQVEQSGSDIEKKSNIYRICGIDNRHAGNTTYDIF